MTRQDMSRQVAVAATHDCNNLKSLLQIYSEGENLPAKLKMAEPVTSITPSAFFVHMDTSK